jgi:hypothetical protein
MTGARSAAELSKRLDFVCLFLTLFSLVRGFNTKLGLFEDFLFPDTLYSVHNVFTECSE